jgi:hypothetical protein
MSEENVAPATLGEVGRAPEGMADGEDPGVVAA